MDKFTLRNLEVFQSASGADGVSLVQTLDKCSSPMGARLLRNWLAMPIMDLKELGARHDIVEYFVGNPEILEDTQVDLGKIGDLERILGRIATGKALPREVMQLGRGLSIIGPIRSRLSEAPEALEKLLKGIKNCEKLLAELPAAERAAMLGALSKITEKL